MPYSAYRLEKKFLTDTAWNYGAFGLMASIGAVINFFIAYWFGVEVLGVFNQIYAIFVVTAQLATMGLHDSAQKHVAQLDHEPDKIHVVSAAAITLAVLIGGLVAGAVYLLSTPIAWVLDSQMVGEGIELAAPGLLFFSLNKLLMGVLSGTRRLKPFAAAQGLRVLIILFVCLSIAFLDQPGYMLGLCFSISELALLPFLIFLLRPKRSHFFVTPTFHHWLKIHFHFGRKAMVNGFLSESYIRIDILILSIFLSDFDVGVYSFAAMFVEGLFQVPVVVRTVSNPELVRLISLGNKAKVIGFCRKVALMSLGMFVMIGTGVLVVFPFLGPYFPKDLVTLSYPLLIILLCGLVVFSTTIPFDHILLQAGQPSHQSLLMTINVMVNVIFNLALIPRFGLYGAATATAIAFICATFTVNLAARKWLGYRRGLLIQD
jgi:O-antigen/teichoic acid export membrane protein